MSLENISPTPATPATPAHVPHDTTDVEDWNTRQHLVMENALAESKAARAAGDLEDDEVAEAVSDANDDGAPEAETKAPPKPAPAVVAPPPVAEPSAEEKSRKASLANAARLERESVKRSTELAAKAAELKATEAKFSEREAKLAAFEKAYSDPDALLALLEERVPPETMSRYFIEAGQPDKVAERRAKAALAGATEPVSAEVAALKKEMAALKAEAETAKAQVQRAASEKDFASRTLEIKEQAPHAARLLNKRPKEFFAMADVAATQIMAQAKSEGRSATWDDVIKDVNQQLADFAKDLADEAAQAAPSTPEKTKNPAAAKAPTVSNRAASERSDILGDDEKWESLPFDERVRRAEKRARATG